MPALYLNQTLTLLTTLSTTLPTPTPTPLSVISVTTTYLLTLLPSVTSVIAASASSLAPALSLTTPVIATLAVASVNTAKEDLSTESVVAIALGIPTLLITGAGMMYKRLGAVSQQRIEEAVNNSSAGIEGDLEAGSDEVVETGEVDVLEVDM